MYGVEFFRMQLLFQGRFQRVFLACILFSFRQFLLCMPRHPLGRASLQDLLFRERARLFFAILAIPLRLPLNHRNALYLSEDFRSCLT